MTVNGLLDRLERLQEVGWGNKNIYVDTGEKLLLTEDIDWSSMNDDYILIITSGK